MRRKPDVCKSCWEELCCTTGDLALRSSVHGIPNIFNNHMFVFKALWLISLLSASGFCLYVTIMATQNYLEYEVVTTIEDIYETKVPFPAVSFCNINGLSTSAAIEFSTNKTEELASLFDSDSGLDGNMIRKYLITSLARDPNMSDAERLGFSAPLTDILISCYFNLRPCKLSDFTW